MSDEKKPRDHAFIKLPGFECRCDGERLEARVEGGPWHWVAMPPPEGAWLNVDLRDRSNER